MFGRSASERERALIKIIDAQQRKIDDLLDRIMLLAGNPWEMPPADVHADAEYVEPDWTATPEQEPDE